MIGWDVCGVIIAIVAFISNMITDAKLKKLSNRYAQLEKELEPFRSFIRED